MWNVFNRFIKALIASILLWEDMNKQEKQSEMLDEELQNMLLVDLCELVPFSRFTASSTSHAARR